VEGYTARMLLAMSLNERDRIRVLEQRQGGQLSQAQAAAQLGVCARQVRRIEARYRSEGDAGLVHQGRGRASNRRVSEPLRERAVACLLQADWRDFGPTFAAEKLAELEGIVVGRETVRRWMIEAGLWRPRARAVTHRSWRQRRECRGELVQMDSSIHDWFEGRGEAAVLIQMVDDATGTKFARFSTTDSTAMNMTMFRDYIQRYGRPRALYTDKASHFVTTRSASVEEELEDRQAETQIARALRELGIEQILAHSPQAKGRIERAFETDQDRLVRDLRLNRISTLEEANTHLERVICPSTTPASRSSRPARQPDHRGAGPGRVGPAAPRRRLPAGPRPARAAGAAG
jgi:transposase